MNKITEATKLLEQYERDAEALAHIAEARATHIRALQAERDAAQAKIEALYFAWLAVDDCEEESSEMEAAVGAMYCAFTEAHSGPDGFRTWKDAAVSERIQRVAAQAELATLRDQIKRTEEQREAWKEAAESQYAQRWEEQGGEEDYPVKGALDSWAGNRWPILKEPK